MSAKAKYTIAIICILFILFISSPFILWKLTPVSELKVLVLDKTVPIADYREHKSLFWLLNFLKINNTDSHKPYDYKKDYFGYFPTKPKYTIKTIQNSIEQPNLIYLADTYGVYQADISTKNVKGKRSSLIYGGLTEDEVTILQSKLVNKTTIIAEFNTLASPTSDAARKKMYAILGMHWNNWIGRYFNDLSRDGEVPAWAINAYEKQTNQSWDFKGPGILYDSTNDDIIVLESKKDLIKDSPSFSFTTDAAREFSAVKSLPYNYWFEVNTCDSPSAEVLASYSISLSDSGKEKLNKYNLPSTFPAIIRNKNSLYTSYYFAGDYVDNKNTPSIFQLKGLDLLKRYITSSNNVETEGFFWKCYVPMMEKIMKQVIIDKKPTIK